LRKAKLRPESTQDNTLANPQRTQELGFGEIESGNLLQDLLQLSTVQSTDALPTEKYLGHTLGTLHTLARQREEKREREGVIIIIICSDRENVCARVSESEGVRA
jgi:hypothetical protein